MRYLPSLTLLAALAFLYGCAAAVIGGAAAGGYMLGEERRPTSVLADDQAIEFKIANQISEKFVGSHVNTTSYNRMVLLTGEVQSAEMKAAVEKIARGTENVRGVYNEVQIGPVTALSARVQRQLRHGQGQGPLRRRRQVSPVAREGRDGGRHGISDGPRQAQGSGRRDGSRTYHRGRAAGGPRLRNPGVGGGACLRLGPEHSRQALVYLDGNTD